VLEEGHDILDFIDSLGLRPGARVSVKQKTPFDGPLVLVVDGVERIIGHNLSQIITVRPVGRLLLGGAGPAEVGREEKAATGRARHGARDVEEPLASRQLGQVGQEKIL
jgi:hypothetical protein